MADGLSPPTKEWIVTEQHIKNCKIVSWYNTFQKDTIKSILLPIPLPLVHLIASDGIQVSRSLFPKPVTNEWEEEEKWEEEEEIGGGQSILAEFPDFEREIVRGIEELGGVVVPKLNWSCPTDVLWMSVDGTLKCRDPEQIFLLLQSSDFIVHDLYHAFDCSGEGVKDGEWSSSSGESEENDRGEKDKEQEGKSEEEEESKKKEELSDEAYTLTLRKWANLQSGREFRCFVANETVLLGISQRDHTNFYPFLLEEKEMIREKVELFFKENVCGNFPDSHYVFDVYVDRKFRVWLLDFNPFCSSTHPSLFDWSELLLSPSLCSSSSSQKEKTQMKIVTSQSNIKTTDAMLNRVPHDVYDVSNADSINQFIKFAKSEQE